MRRYDIIPIILISAIYRDILISTHLYYVYNPIHAFRTTTKIKNGTIGKKYEKWRPSTAYNYISDCAIYFVVVRMM